MQEPPSGDPGSTTAQNRARRKESITLVNEAYHPDRALHKALGAFDLVAFGIGAIIGAGIFALAGTAAAGQLAGTQDFWTTPVINLLTGGDLGRGGAGPAIVMSFVVAGFACAMAALCYAELASTIPVAGSAYTFAYATLGEMLAWIIGWDLILEYMVASIAVAVGWSGYFMRFLHGVFGLQFPLWLTADMTTALSRVKAMPPQQAPLYSSTTLPTLFGHEIAMNIPAFCIIAVITGLLVWGIRESARANRIFVLVKLGVVLLFIAVGACFVHPHNWVPFAPTGLAGIMGGAAIVFFAYIGFDAVSATAEEAKNPQRDMPIGIIGSLAICTVLYILVSGVLTGILPYKTYAGDPAAVATALASTAKPWSDLATPIVSLGAVAGLTSVLLVLMLSQPRIFMAMARDGLLPAWVGKIHPKFRTPYITTIIAGALVGFFALMIDIGQAAELANIGTLAAFVIVCGGVILLRKHEPDTPRPFRCPAVPVIPILGMLSCFGLMIALPVITWVRFFVWLAIGLIIYFAYGRTHSKLHTP